MIATCAAVASLGIRFLAGASLHECTPLLAGHGCNWEQYSREGCAVGMEHSDQTVVLSLERAAHALCRVQYGIVC